MKFFGLSLIAFLAGSVVASPVPSDNTAAVSNIKQGAVADLLNGLDTDLKAILGPLRSETGLARRGNVADAIKSLEVELNKEITALLDETDLTKRQDVSGIVADIDALISKIKEQYGVSKRGEACGEVSGLLDEVTDLLGQIVDAVSL